MPPSRRDWSALREELAGDLLLPGTDEYESARKPFIARFDEIEPAAVVRCATADDATSAMVFASRFSLETVPRSGGHCLAGYSSTRDLLLDLSPLSEVVVADDIVTVGAGTPTGKLCERLCEHGLAIPTGTCPSVGIAGLTLGGGIGILGRAHGLTLDHLVAAHVVLADGRVADCDEQRHGDLFWALRGAGARNFGVVTSFTFEARPAPAMTNFRLVWPYRHAAAVIATWQAWAPLGPDELSADLVLSATGDPSSDPLVEVIGAVIGSPGDARDLLDRLATRAESDPQSEDCRELSYRDTCRLQAELSVSYDQLEQTSQGPLRRQGYRFTKSELFERPLAADAIAALLDNFAAKHARGQTRSVGFAPWGGAYNRRSPQATAFAHRDQLFSIEHLAIIDPAAPGGDKDAAHEWVRRSWETVHRCSSGCVYPCFPDADLRNWGTAYYGDNLPKLRKVKAKYDPGNVFRFEQSLPLR